MNLEDYINWNEVISENEFRYYLAELFKNKNKYSSEVLLDIIDILGDKYGKFYGSLKLSKEEKENLSRILFDLTNFSNCSKVCCKPTKSDLFLKFSNLFLSSLKLEFIYLIISFID